MLKLNKKIISIIASVALLTQPLLTSFTTASAGQLLGQTDFEDGVGLPWHVCESMTGEMDFEIDNGVYKITIVNPGGASNGGEDRWDCQFRYRGLTIEQGCTYDVSFDITASNDCSYYTKIGDMAEPYAEDWHGEPDSSQYDSFWDVKWLSANQKVTVTGKFTATRTAEVEWAFHIGGDSVPAGTVFTFDNMSLICEDSNNYDYVEEEEWQRSDILTNQVGYFENCQKKATLLTDDTSSVEFYLKDESGNTVYTGNTTPFGYDKDSDDNVQIIDFSDFTQTGKYYLETKNGSKSREFTIGINELYSGMLYDGLNYYYQNRSGIEIQSEYISSGDTSALARSAGHASDVASIEQTWGYTSSSGTQDVTGGWYDAGDHGKYVVNGGISLWMMQNIYERAKTNGDTSAFDDSSMLIPENSNSYPDILDEARYEMEWMLKMIVADGDCKGMAYHKVHDIKWTALGMAPSEDTLERIIKPPTTAATLNLAACAAQSARLWQDYDSDFANTCLEAAKTAYEAAKTHPDMYAPLDESVGGGPYGDDYVDDEFYWAACELYITTGDSSYLSDLQSNENYLKIQTSISNGENVDTFGTFDWGNTAALGSLSLVLNNSVIESSEYDKLVSNITSAADYYNNEESSQGYGLPYGQSTISYNDSDTGYVWGSNSFVLDNAVIIAYAYDLTDNSDYLNGAVSAMDYILGRNANDYSYVTGYGTHTSQYPHHRYWSGQEFDEYPYAPCGVLTGGPNSGMQDPWVKGSGWKKGAIAPQKCYLDNIEAWSVNECTINWNASLIWIDSFLLSENGGIVQGVTGSSLGIVNVDSDNNVNLVENSTDSNSSSDTQNDNKQNNSTNSNNNNSAQNSSNAVNNTETDTDKKSGVPYTGIIIGAVILLGLISVEVFIYNMAKMSKKK
jgi:endoglucanase